MKNKNLTFIPGTDCGHFEKVPAIELPDGSRITLHNFDPNILPRSTARAKRKLPTIDTRNELGALFAAAPELLAACQTALRLIQDPDGDAFQASSAEDVLTSAIAKAKQTP